MQKKKKNGWKFLVNPQPAPAPLLNLFQYHVSEILACSPASNRSVIFFFFCPIFSRTHSSFHVSGYLASAFNAPCSLQRRDLLHQGGCSEPWCGLVGLMKRMAAVHGWITHVGSRQRQADSQAAADMAVISHLVLKPGLSTKQAVITSLFGPQASFTQTVLETPVTHHSAHKHHPHHVFKSLPPGGKISPKTKRAVIFGS